MVKNLKYTIACMALVFTVLMGMSFKNSTAPQIKTIVIDAGHGGKDPGCQGSIHKEKDVALAVALKLGKYLEQNLKGVRVIYTRTTDVFVELEDRAVIANRAKADLFISIHCNAAGKPVIITDPKTGKKRVKTYRNKKGKIVNVETTNPVPFGSETYVMGVKNEEGKMKVASRENSAMLLEDNYESKYGGFDPEREESYIIMSSYTSAYVIQSASLAMKIQEEYARKAGRIDKGVHRQSIWVLWRTSMPSILTELGYLTNPLEESFLGSENGQEYLAKALFRGIRKYKDEFEGVRQTYVDEFENQVALENENVKAGNTNTTKKEDDGDSDVDSVQIVAKTPAEPVVENMKAEDTDSSTTQNVSAPASGKNNSGSPATSSIMFRVQFASSDGTLDLKQQKFADIVDADFYKVGNVLKYTSGKFPTVKEAQKHQDLLRTKGFRDCFVVAFNGTERISVNDAMKLLRSTASK